MIIWFYELRFYESCHICFVFKEQPHELGDIMETKLIHSYTATELRMNPLYIRLEL